MLASATAPGRPTVLSLAQIGSFVGLLALVVAFVSGGRDGCSRGRGLRAAEAAAVGPWLLVPRASGAIHCDGKLDEPDWSRAAKTGSFVDPLSGLLASPFSDARFLWDETFLYIALHAVDRDVRAATGQHDGPVAAGDAFSLRLRPQPRAAVAGIDVAPSAAFADFLEPHGAPADLSWESGAVAGASVGGPVGERSGDDAWQVELAVPWASLPGGGPPDRLTLSISRCDAPRQPGRLCARWGHGLEGGVLELLDTRPGR